ncbi:hypothetical protein FRB96_001588 [Tulasnella sp. 330]|nr:hypothetical protein FRB96_001588 [Tulasnella sp. 330]KAG8876038.1 hypothetical protein FRB97_004504 [Tulasnella sp. 331]
MNNTSTIHLDIVLERPQSKDVMRALLHAILFHRLFGIVKPQTIDVLDVTFPGVSDPDIESQVNSKVDALWRALDTIPGGNHVAKKGQTSYQTYTSKPIFNKPPPTPTPTDLNQTLLQILTHVSSNQGRDAVPPIMTNTGISPFPVRIDVLVGDRMVR